MTLDDRVRALTSLHLTPRQTRFVALVALHSGYCLRRQYLTFAGLQYGKSVREFLDGLVTRGLASRFAYRRDRGYLYHLSARSLYRAIDQEENRNRRHTSPALIARKLMVFDYVLGHHEREWYATEQDKVALFTARFGVSVEDLPHRVYTATDAVAGSTTRYFIHKLPIYLEGEPPVVHFVHLVTDETGRGFEQFLIDHARLFSRLPAWAVDAIGVGPMDGLSACQKVFHAFLAAPAGPTPGDLADVQWFFETRRLVDAGQLGGLSVADLNRFRDARSKFNAPAIAGLYAQWLVEGDRALRRPATDGSSIAARPGRLVMEHMAGQYAEFGALAGVV
jgi:hypothetical protein